MPHGHVQAISFHEGSDAFDVEGYLYGYKQNAMVNVQVFLTQGTATASGSVYAQVQGNGKFTMSARVSSVDVFDLDMPVLATALATEIWTSTLTPQRSPDAAPADRPAPRAPVPAAAAAQEKPVPVRTWRFRRESWDHSNVLPEVQ